MGGGQANSVANAVDLMRNPFEPEIKQVGIGRLGERFPIQS